jgi:hypothetical protein
VGLFFKNMSHYGVLKLRAESKAILKDGMGAAL